MAYRAGGRFHLLSLFAGAAIGGAGVLYFEVDVGQDADQDHCFSDIRRFAKRSYESLILGQHADGSAGAGPAPTAADLGVEKGRISR